MEIFDWSRLLRDISDLVFLALTGALEVRMLLCLSVHLHYALFGIFGSDRSSGSANVTLSVHPHYALSLFTRELQDCLRELNSAYEST